MKELKIKNSQIPYYSLSKENSMIIRKMTSTDKAQLLDAIIDFIYEGKETEFENPLLEGIFDATISSTDRLAKSYFSRAESGRTSAKKRIENKSNTSDLSIYTSTDDKDITLIEEKVTESQKTTKNKTKSSDWVKDNYNRLNEIKTNLNSSLSVQRRIAETNLNDLLNSQIGETYKEEIKSFVYS